VRRERE
jgi:hypothetical protein